MAIVERAVGEAGGVAEVVWPNAGAAKQSAIITSTNNFCAGFLTCALSPFPKCVFQVGLIHHSQDSEQTYRDAEKHERQARSRGVQSQAEQANRESEKCYEKSDEYHFF